MKKKFTKLAQIIKNKLIENPDIKAIDIVKASGMTAGYVSMWLNGKVRRDPSDEYVEKIAPILNMTPAELLTHSNTKSRTLSKGTTRILAVEVCDINQEHVDTVKEILEIARGGLSETQWKKILAIAKNKNEG